MSDIKDIFGGVTARLGFTTITSTNRQFKIDGWINPTFTNLGESPVEINGVIYNQNETYDASVGDFPVVDTIRIVFAPASLDQKQRLIANYGVLVKENQDSC